MAITLIKHQSQMWVAQLSGPIDDLLKRLDSSHSGDFWTLTSTQDEVSLVSPIESHEHFAKVEGPWTLFQVAGVLDFGLTGILNSLTQPMAQAGISIFAISTYNTDYILIQSDAADQAAKVWSDAGFPFAPAQF